MVSESENSFEPALINSPTETVCASLDSTTNVKTPSSLVTPVSGVISTLVSGSLTTCTEMPSFALPQLSRAVKVNVIPVSPAVADEDDNSSVLLSVVGLEKRANRREMGNTHVDINSLLREGLLINRRLFVNGRAAWI